MVLAGLVLSGFADQCYGERAGLKGAFIVFVRLLTGSAHSILTHARTTQNPHLPIALLQWLFSSAIVDHSKELSAYTNRLSAYWNWISVESVSPAIHTRAGGYTSRCTMGLARCCMVALPRIWPAFPRSELFDHPALSCSRHHLRASPM